MNDVIAEIMKRFSYDPETGAISRQIFLGDFNDIEAARDAYRQAAIEQFGEFYAP